MLIWASTKRLMDGPLPLGPAEMLVVAGSVSRVTVTGPVPPVSLLSRVKLTVVEALPTTRPGLALLTGTVHMALELVVPLMVLGSAAGRSVGALMLGIAPFWPSSVTVTLAPE